MGIYWVYSTPHFPYDWRKVGIQLEVMWKGSHNAILRGQQRSPWLLTTYPNWYPGWNEWVGPGSLRVFFCFGMGFDWKSIVDTEILSQICIQPWTLLQYRRESYLILEVLILRFYHSETYIVQSSEVLLGTPMKFNGCFTWNWGPWNPGDSELGSPSWLQIPFVGVDFIALLRPAPFSVNKNILLHSAWNGSYYGWSTYPPEK